MLSATLSPVQKVSPKDVMFGTIAVPTGLPARCIHWRNQYVGNVVLAQGKWCVGHETQGHADMMDAVAVLVDKYLADMSDRQSWSA